MQKFSLEVKGTNCILTVPGKVLPFVCNSTLGTEALINWFYNKKLISPEVRTSAILKIESIKKEVTAGRLKISLKPEPGKHRYCQPSFKRGY